MVVWGGSDTGGAYQQSGGVYDPGTNTWTPTSLAGAPLPRLGHKAVWTGSRMLIWGGLTSGNTILNSGGLYDPTTATWSPMSTTNVPSARTQHGVAWTGTRLLVWGGSTPTGSCCVDTGGQYDPSADQWLALTTTGAPQARGVDPIVFTGTHLLLWGGQTPGTVATGGLYLRLDLFRKN
jgi:N-acetylneuraminic acid mutarotase